MLLFQVQTPVSTDIPPGCSVQGGTGGDWAAHWNGRSGFCDVGKNVGTTKYYICVRSPTGGEAFGASLLLPPGTGVGALFVPGEAEIEVQITSLMHADWGAVDGKGGAEHAVVDVHWWVTDPMNATQRVSAVYTEYIPVKIILSSRIPALVLPAAITVRPYSI